MKASVLALIPVKAGMHPDLQRRALELAGRMPAANPWIDLVTVFDSRVLAKDPGDTTPWSKVTRVRNTLLDCFKLSAFTHVLWIDADLVEYPADLPSQLIKANPHGVSSCPVFIEDREGEFYDTAAFVGLDDRHWEVFSPHHADAAGRQVVDVAGVGCLYTVPVPVYQTGVRHTDHPTNTDHWAICQAARKLGRTVTVDMRLRALHANLPKYGEAWH